MNKSDLQQASGKYWEELFAARGQWGAYPSEELIRCVARHFTDNGTRRVLEIGCGPGANLWYLLREGWRVAGIDISTTALRMAKRRMVAEGLPADVEYLDLREGNFTSLPWQNETFDAVIDIASLYANTMATIRLTVNEIYRNLKADGVFFGKMFGRETTGSDSGIAIELGTRFRPSRGPCAGNEVAHFFTRDELVSLFANFSQISIESMIRTDQNGSIKIFYWLVTAKK